jgi:hypothetical protein
MILVRELDEQELAATGLARSDGEEGKAGMVECLRIAPNAPNLPVGVPDWKPTARFS